MQPSQPQNTNDTPSQPKDPAPQAERHDVAAEIGLTAVQATGMGDQAQSEFSGYDMTAAAGVPQPEQSPAPIPEVTWEASEYIHHEKDFMWFGTLGLIASLLIGFAIWLQAWTFILLIVVMAAALIVFANRPPRVLHYSLSSDGLAIEDKHLAYNDFRGFGVVTEKAAPSVVLLPRKRFMPSIDLFFNPQDGEKIVDVLGAHLPLIPIKPDLLDNLARKLRF